MTDEIVTLKRDIVHLMEILGVLWDQLGRSDTDKQMCLLLIASAFKAMEGQY